MTLEEMKAEVIGAGWQWLVRSIDPREAHLRGPGYFVHISNFDRDPNGVVRPNERSIKTSGPTELAAFVLAFEAWKASPFFPRKNWRVQQEAGGEWSIYEGEAYRKGPFPTEAKATVYMEMLRNA